MEKLQTKYEGNFKLDWVEFFKSESVQRLWNLSVTSLKNEMEELINIKSADQRKIKLFMFILHPVEIHPLIHPLNCAYLDLHKTETN